MNIYIDGPLPALRKRSWVNYHIREFDPHFPTLSRVALLSIFIVPPVFFYCLSLFLLNSPEYFLLDCFGGVVIGAFALSTLSLELEPWHAKKIFPGPRSAKYRTWR